MSDNPELKIDATLATENIPAQTARLISEMSRLADTINTHGARAAQGLADVGHNADGLAGAFTHVGEQFEHAFSGRAILGEIATGFLAIAGPIAIVETGLEGVREVIGEIREFSKEGIIKSDELRDLGLSLNIIEHSAVLGAEAFARMEGAAEKTRNVGDELIATYRRLEPLASARGFSHEQLQGVTNMLSQLSTIRGVDLETMAGGFQQLLAGRVMPGRNPLLAALGITRADIKDLGWDQLVDKMAEVSSHFPELGQSFDSELKKIKEDLLITFAEGFNGARGEAMHGMEGVREALADPQVREAIHELGTDVAKLAALIGDLSVAATAFHISDDLKTLFDLGKAFPTNWPVALMSHVVTSAAEAGKQMREQSAYDAANVSRTSQLALGQELLGGMGATSSDRGVAYGVGSVYGSMSNAQALVFLKELRSAADDGRITFGEMKRAEDLAFAVIDDKAPKGKVAISALKDEAHKLAEAFANAEVSIGKMLGYEGKKPGLMALLTPGKLGSIDQLNFPSQYGIDQGAWNLANGDTGFRAQLSDEQLRWTETTKRTMADERLKWRDDLSSVFSDAAVAFAENGGRHFGQIGANAFRIALEQGGKALGDVLTNLVLGAHVDPKTGQLVNASGELITASQLAKGKVGAQGLLAGIGDAYAGYQAGLSGAPGARTGATLSGAAAGAGIGAEFGTAGGPAGIIVGAAIGAIVGAIGGAIGAAQRQSEYKYGIPGIDATGHAYFSSTKNYDGLTGAADVKAIVRQIQEVYDTIHDSLARTLMKLDGVILPVITAINGQFQPNPSGPFEKHLQAWIAGTEGDEVFKQFKPQMDAVGAALGFGVNKWNQIMSDLDLVDPQKRAQLFDQLVTAKQEINKALTFFIGNTSYTSLQGRSGSAAYETYFGDLSLHKPFTSTQRETDDEIIRFANNIKNLSFEGQIQAEAELATKITDRAAAVRSAIEGIFQAFEDGAKKYRDAFESVDVLGFTRADGTVDQAGLSLYYKNKAQQDLEQERFASTPQLVTQYNDQFIKDIMAAGAASLAAGATAADVAKWEREQLTSGQGFFTAQLTKLGTDIDKLNDSFLTKLDPALTALYGSTSNLDTVIGKVGDHLGKIIDPIDRTGAGLDSVASSALSVVIAFNAMIDRFNTASSSDFNSSISRLRASR